MSDLVTGEAVALDLNLAALPSRAVARVIDLLGQILLFYVLVRLLGPTVNSGAAAAALGILLSVATFIGYPVAFETFMRGRTPGKVVMGLRVLRDDGGPIAFRQAFVRGMSIAVDLITSFVVSVITMSVSPRSKRVGDLLAGTVVVQERVPIPTVMPAQMPPPLAAWAATLELTGLSDELALQVRQYLARAGAMSPGPRADLEARLVAAVRSVTAPQPPPDAPGWAYLAAVMAERRERDARRLASRQGPVEGGQWAPGARASQPSYVAPATYEPAPSYARSTDSAEEPDTAGFHVPG